MRPILTALACLTALHLTAGSAVAWPLLCPAVQKVAISSAIGDANLDFEGDVLTVSNIGTSGQDGVEFDMRVPVFHTIGTIMDWQWWDPNDSLPVGAMFRSEILGTIGGVPDQRIATWQMEKTAAATYDSTLDFSLHRRTRILLAEQDGTIIGEIPNVPEGAAVVMRVWAELLDPLPLVPFQQAWIFGEGTEGASSGEVPLPPGMEVFCGELFECEFHAWPALSEVGLRIGDDLVQTIATDPNQTTGILAVLGDGSVRSSVEEITTLRLTFANIPEFQIGAIQQMVVPEPGGLTLLAIGFIAPLIRFRFKSISENRRGLAQFAESSEQIVPDPLPKAVLG